MITVAGDARGVVGLVYVAAFVLAEGESCVDVAQGFPATLLLDALQPPEFRDDLGIPGVDLYLRRDAYAAVIGADLPRPTTEVMAATQRPVSAAALAEKAAARPWQSVPSWYLVATADQVIHPDAQRFMARRASAEIVEVNASHSVASSQPERVAALIRRALGPVLGREAELQLIRELPDAVGEQVAALVIRGEPGIGKSALISDQSNPPSPTR